YENGIEANNILESPEFFDVMAIPYADLWIPQISVSGPGKSGQPLNISWRVENKGIGLTNVSSWNDVVWVSTDAAGLDEVGSSQWFAHLGQMNPGDGY